MVMHARKPQRLNDGYFEKHQAHPYQSSKYSSKRDYEREASSRSTNYLRGNDRDLSPNSSVPSGIALNNGNSYRADSPDLDSPRESRDRDRSDRYQSSSYIQKIKDRGRNDYKKDKYSLDKRDRRDRDAEHRTNHDRIDMSGSRRSSKLCNLSSSDKRSGSDDRDRGGERDRNDRDIRDRDRDRDRDHRDRERSSGTGGDRDRERLNRMGDWSEHVSSSGKKYYYNCKTEVSQWEKPKEWLDKERNISKETHRDYRDKERDRDREDRFARSSYVKHSSSRNSRLRWPHEAENMQIHRRRNEDNNQDMDISPGDSTPTSEASYSHTSTPNAQPQQNLDGPVLLANVLPRLASHPSTPTNSQLHFTTPSSASVINTSSSTCTVSSSSGNSNLSSGMHLSSTSALSSSSSTLAKLNKCVDNNSLHNATLPTSSPSTHVQYTGNNSSNSNSNNNHGIGQHSTSTIHSSLSSSASLSTGNVLPTSSVSSELIMNSNAPGPPTPVTLANLPKILSQITGNKQIDQNDMNPQKALQTINNALLMSSRQQQQQQQQQHSTAGGAGDGVNQIANNNSNSNSLREHALNSPLYNLPHNMSHSMLNHTNIGGNGGNGNGGQYVQSSASSGMISTQATGLGIGISSQFSAAGLKADGSSTLLVSDGPPTPTQELDTMSGDHRKMDGTSASLSSLQSVVTSSQILRHQGPCLTPSLGNYVRADLIAHVTNWPAELLEKQAQISSDEANIVGDLQCTKVSADLKSARSVVRITEITATLQEQKVMYLRQQIRRLEELKSQNSFMSEDL